MRVALFKVVLVQKSGECVLEVRNVTLRRAVECDATHRMKVCPRLAAPHSGYKGGLTKSLVKAAASASRRITHTSSWVPQTIVFEEGLSFGVGRGRSGSDVPGHSTKVRWIDTIS